MSINITLEGVVSKDGAKLGIIADGVMSHYEPISGPVKGQIRTASCNPELAFQLVPAAGSEEAEQAPPQPKQAPLSDAELLALAKARGLLPAAPAVAAPPAVQAAEPGSPEFVTDRHRALDALYARVRSGEVSRPPATMIGLGDKTPAYVQWVKANVSEEDFKSIYSRKLPTMESHQEAVAKLERISKLGSGDVAHVIRVN